MIALRPAAGMRLVLPDGGTTLDGLSIAPGQDMPSAGAVVTDAIWAHKRLREQDAELLSEADVAAGADAARAREKPERADTHGGP